MEDVPLILGHEGVGIVTAIGEGGVASVSVGDRVTWSIADSCGHCVPCSVLQLPQKCGSLFKYGHAATHKGHGLNGTFGTHCILGPGTHVSEAAGRPARVGRGKME